MKSKVTPQVPEKDLKTPEDSTEEASSALSYDRDKNKSYLASDESVDEIVNKDGYQVIHPNREIDIKKI